MSTTTETTTPGPWTWKDFGGYWRLVNDAGSWILDDGSACGEYNQEIDPLGPDAHLIAAAPELLDALKDAEEEFRLLRMKDTQAVYNPGLRARISLVIAKAGGQ